MHSGNLNKLILILLVSIFGQFSTFCQGLKTISKEEEYEYLRLLCLGDLIQFSAYMSTEEYKSLLKNTNRIFKIDTLESIGFKNVTFVKLTFSSRDSLNSLYNDLEMEGNFVGQNQYIQGAEYFIYPILLNHEYIFASSTIGIFKLKGFRVNEFMKFFGHCYNSEEFFDSEEINSRRGRLSNESILKFLSIEGLNLIELYKAKVDIKKQ